MVGAVFDKILKTKFLRKLVKGSSADNARAHLGEETFRLSWVCVENKVAHNEVEDGIAKIFKPLVGEAIVAHTDFSL